MVLTGKYVSTGIKIRPSVYLTTKNPRWPDLGLNQNLLEGKPATIRSVAQEMREIFSSGGIAPSPSRWQNTRAAISSSVLVINTSVIIESLVRELRRLADRARPYAVHRLLLLHITPNSGGLIALYFDRQGGDDFQDFPPKI
jgi:hypothetical protein